MSNEQAAAQAANTTTEQQQESQAAATKGGESGTYTPPASQEEFDKIIADRLTRERSKYAGWDEIKAKASEYDKVVEANKSEAEKRAEEMAKLRAENEGYKTREQVAAWAKEVSDETGVAADLLRGSTREELLAHAEQIKPLIAQPSTGLKPISGEGQSSALALNGDGIESALKNALGIK